MENFIKAHPELFIARDSTLRDALQKLNDSAKKTLFLEIDGRLCGALTDGDIRRWMLKGGSLDAPVEKAANLHPKFLFDTERCHAGEKLQEWRIDAIPIVDENLNVVDVATRYANISTDKVVIRELTKSDLPMLLEFFDQMAGDTRAMFNRNDVNRIRAVEFFNQRGPLDQIQFAAVVHGAEGEEMVGYVFLWDLDTRIPWLGIAVRESWKGHHLGRLLMRHAEKFAADGNCGGVMLTSVPANIRAHALYTRMGYEYYGSYPDGEFLFLKRFVR